MQTRRAFAAAAASSLIGLAGCRGDDGNGASNAASATDAGAATDTAATPTAGARGEAASRPSFADGEPTDALDWLGPTVAATASGWTRDDAGPDRIGVTVVAPEPIRSNDHVPDWWVAQNTLETLDTRAAATFEFGAGAVDRWIAHYGSAFRVATGAFDPDALADGLPADATGRGSYRGLDVYTAPTKGGFAGRYDAYALGAERFVAALSGPDPEAARGLVEGLLDTRAGDRDRLTATSETFATLASGVGERPYLEVSVDGETGGGLGLRPSGSMLERRSINAAATPAAAAEAHPTQSAFEHLREPSEGDTEYRDPGDKFVPYESAERRREGRYVVIDGRLPLEDLSDVDLRYP